MEELHNMHPGVSKMKVLARSYIWWPKMYTEIDGMTWTSSHLECESTMTKNILSMNGPAKSMCSRLHGWLGHSQVQQVAMDGFPGNWAI